MKCELGAICSRLSSGKSISAKLVSAEGKYPVYGGNGLRGYSNVSNFDGECAIIGRQGAFCGNVRYFKGAAYMTEHAIVVCADGKNDTRYLAYLLSHMQLGRLSAQSAQPGLSVKTLSKQIVDVPLLETQKRIAAILSSLDDKIENNKRINRHLEQMAQALFKSWFVDFAPFGGKMPSDWNQGRLTDIANYRNGLAMQKFRPRQGEAGLPVLKIKELRQGLCDETSERCSSGINADYLVHDGDVVFSWSGSLLVDFWCGGDCGLNQHLFKVTSETYDKWFYYAWTNHYLAHFIAMAADKATTMGHIKREALEQAEVFIPNQDEYVRLGKQFAPLYNNIIENRLENRRLAALRDTLLPRLMSGELSVGVGK